MKCAKQRTQRKNKDNGKTKECPKWCGEKQTPKSSRSRLNTIYLNRQWKHLVSQGSEMLDFSCCLCYLPIVAFAFSAAPCRRLSAVSSDEKWFALPRFKRVLSAAAQSANNRALSKAFVNLRNITKNSVADIRWCSKCIDVLCHQCWGENDGKERVPKYLRFEDRKSVV